MTVVVWMRLMFFYVCWCDFLACIDVYGVFVVVECCLFLEYVFFLFCKWMKWMCGLL